MTTRLKRDSEEVNQLVEAYQPKGKLSSPSDFDECPIGLTRHNVKTGELEVCIGRTNGQLRWCVIQSKCRG